VNVLSLFDGMSCGQIALNKAGISYSEYFASEIDPYAISVTQKNYPNTIQLGDVTKVKGSKLPKIDLLMGGSPCQGFSFAGKQLNFNDPRSKLFFEYTRLLEECKPTYFFLENVIMVEESEQVITDTLGVDPIEMNSSLVSAQNRRRLYWTNIPDITQPEDRNLFLKDIVSKGVSIKTVRDSDRNLRHERKLSQKSLTCTATMYKGAGNNGVTLIRREGQEELSILYVDEVERLQTVPQGYTDCVSNTQRYKMLGNGWTIDIVSHIFKNIGKPVVKKSLRNRQHYKYLF